MRTILHHMSSHDVTPPLIDSLLSVRELLDVSQQLERLLAVGLTHGELFARALHFNEPRPLIGQLATQLNTATETTRLVHVTAVMFKI